MKTIIAIFLFLNSLMVYAQNVKTYIPTQAYQYIPKVNQEAVRLMPDFPYPYYFASLIEHESCISLKHSKCWNPKSKLSTKRELGIGLGQMTKTFREDGSIRFDVLSDLKKAYSQELKELSWSTIEIRPDLQIRSIILMTRNSYKNFYMIPDSFERISMADSAYNGGARDVNKSRMVCGLSKECDPKKWFNNVERYCVKSKKPLYGGRSACDINTYHVKDVMFTRLPKYRNYFETLSL